MILSAVILHQNMVIELPGIIFLVCLPGFLGMGIILLSSSWV